MKSFDFSCTAAHHMSTREVLYRLATSRPFRSEKVIWSDEVARASVVSRERSTCFTCKNVSQSVNFWREIPD